MSSHIEILGAREHNLKNVNVSIPKRSMTVFTGVSGSGKSSLVYDTLYAEAQRQLIETFSSFARRRLPKINRPDVDEVRDMTTTIVIDQKKMGVNPRSTVGTATELYTYLRLLFSRAGEPLTFDSRVFGFNNPYGMCPTCKGLGRELDVDLDAVLDTSLSLEEGAIKHPHFKKDGWYYKIIKGSGLFPMEKPLREWDGGTLNTFLYAEKFKVDSPAIIHNVNYEGLVTLLKRRTLNTEEAPTYLEKDVNIYTYRPCSDCGGSRINERARSVKLNGRTIPELADMELTDLLEFLEGVRGPTADPIVGRMKPILRNLIDIGVGYLSLNRGVGTLSGGESQRVKMARQLGCDLVDITYVFDEPSIGLHQRDIGKLVDMLTRLRDRSNTVLVVEHDPTVMRSADHIVDMGPGAGSQGGNVTFTGGYEELLGSDTLTGEYLRDGRDYRRDRRKQKGFIEIKDACVHNLKNVSVKVPTGVMTCVTGVAGSGKSSLIVDVLAKRRPDAIMIDQSAAWTSSRSTPATYTKVFDQIRKVYAESTGKPAKLFSFNSEGACPKCRGMGKLRLEMFFLESVTVTCDECEGRRYKPEVLELKHKGRNISEVLNMTVDEALTFFDQPQIRRRLKVISDVGLGYLQLGQPLSTLSGGEAQRIKLASQLHRRGNTYILDEPTTGLHMADIEKLLYVLNRLVDRGNTVIVIEHNMDVIRGADWVIDMGPEGGNGGGRIMAEGTPEQVAERPGSHTGRYLKTSL